MNENETRRRDRSCVCPLCAYWPDSDPRAEDPMLLEEIDNVLGYGWHVTSVLPSESTPPWSYTIGLWHTLGHAELVLCGIEYRTAIHVLNTVGERVRRGEPLAAGHQVCSPDFPYPLAVRPVHDDWYGHLLSMIPRFYRVPPVPALQLVWPDPRGVFPWEDGFAPELTDFQPWLWLSEREHHPSVWRDFDRVNDRTTSRGHPDCRMCQIEAEAGMRELPD